MTKEIWVFSENINLIGELLSKASEVALKINGSTAAVILSSKIGDLSEFFKYGANRIYLVENEKLDKIIPEVYANLLEELVKRYNPIALIISSTKNGKDIAAKIAAKLKLGCATECIDIDYDSDKEVFKVKKTVYAGKAIATEIIKSKPAVITVPPRTFEAVKKEERRGEVVRITDIEIISPQVKIIEEREKEVRGVPLEEAEILVVGGRGFRRKEDFKMLEELAELLRGQVSCSRPISADLKWLPDWVGLSGHKVKPKLYMGFGVSGAVQHLAGIQGSKIIVAINKDPEAPIFKAADYGIVGDLYEVLPALIRALRKRKSPQKTF